MFDNLFSHLDSWNDSVQSDNDNLPDDHDYELEEADSSYLSWINPDDLTLLLDNHEMPVDELEAENWNPQIFDGLGDPIADAAHWQPQQGSSSCAVVAQISVYESITGNEISESEACRIAEANGWFDPANGTTPENIGKLLNAFGVPTHKSYDASLEEIALALEQGDKVIVGLDSNEIWQPRIDPATGQALEQPDAGHAVWVTGIDQQPDGSVQVILNDSGNPDGRMMAVDAKDFLNAWQDYDNLLVVAGAPTALA